MKNPKVKVYESVKIETIKEILEIAEKEAGDKIAFKYKNKGEIKEVTYREFRNDTNYLGTALATINMLDNHIAVIGENRYEWITAYLTVLNSNGVMVPIDKELTCEEIINVLRSSDSEVLFFSGRYEKYIEKIKKELPSIKYFIGFDKEENENNVLSYKQFMEEGKEKLENGNNKYISIEHKNTNSLKMLVYTSGTTDKPKGVMLSEHNLVSVIYYGLQVASVQTRCLSVLPYHHTYEAVAGILVGLHKHVTICINDSLNNVLKNLKTFNPDYVYLVPAFTEAFYKNIWSNAKKTGKEKQLKLLIKISNFLRKLGIDKRKVFFKSIHEAFGGELKQIVCGGAPIRPEVGKFFNDIGIMLLNGFGITECSPLVSVNKPELNDCSTVGTVLSCCKIKFENVTPEGDGEICVKGDIVMLGYYKDKERTDKVLKNGWFNTEDYGRFNNKNQLVINGRKKNIIVLDNGKNVYPEEIENYILNIPYVAEAVVRGIKNNIGQETGLLAEIFVNNDKVKELGIMNISEQLKSDIAMQVKNLPVYKHITEIKLRDKEFEKTTTNKIKR